ncbi:MULTISPECIES: phage tail terminator protein [Aeromonas]|uniref:phage tail terminator protein n=1 Tax=Aeromonas TaxID=642 RepID=UPI00051B1ECA|nr:MULTISPECIES: phage tail terminator protein [Aeromonas]MBV7439060.1 phage minor tail U family protein [Aeromonas sp. sif2416]
MTIRTDIREALAALVQTALPELRAVYPSRPCSVDPEDLPLAFCYFTEGGDGDYALDEEGEAAPLTVSIYVSEHNQADAELDALADKVKLKGNELGGLLLEGLSSAGWQYGADEQGTGLASLTLNFNATWSE